MRRALVKGRIGPPKSRHGRREVRLTEALARDVQARLAEDGDRESTALFFTNEAGGPIDPGNLRSRVLKPLVEEVGAPWAGFHAFRHTFASIHLAEGTNLVALSRALGHHSAAFTLSRYTHLLPGDCAPALPLDSALTFEEPLVGSDPVRARVTMDPASASLNTLRRCDGTPQ